MEKQKLSTIQRRENLNEVYRACEPGPGGACHEYEVTHHGSGPSSETVVPIQYIHFQKGPRSSPESTHGVVDQDLLEIVRDRLTAFQSGDMACRENACALTHIEEALLWLNKRVEDRIERGVLGTMEK